MSTRRNCIKALGAALAAAPLPAQVSSKAEASKLAMPGLYRGRVIAVHNPAALVSGQFQRDPIRQVLAHGRGDQAVSASSESWVETRPAS